jgi:hypothetical protein
VKRSGGHTHTLKPGPRLRTGQISLVASSIVPFPSGESSVGCAAARRGYASIEPGDRNRGQGRGICLLE